MTLASHYRFKRVLSRTLRRGGPQCSRTPATIAAPPKDPVTAPSPDPMLVALLGHDRVAILLASAAGSEGSVDAGPLTMYSDDPILTVGYPVAESSLPPSARSLIAARYTLYAVDGSTCVAPCGEHAGLSARAARGERRVEGRALLLV